MSTRDKRSEEAFYFTSYLDLQYEPIRTLLVPIRTINQLYRSETN
jgi:hypothetical protein